MPCVNLGVTREAPGPAIPSSNLLMQAADAARPRRTDTHRRAADWTRTADRGQNAAKITVL